MNTLKNERHPSGEIKKTMDRRGFCKKCMGSSIFAFTIAYPGIASIFPVSDEGVNINVSLPNRKGMRKLFMKMGSCAHLLFYLLNREYGQRKEDEERAIDQLAGGIAEQGYQCGMLWGASMGAAAEAYRMYSNPAGATVNAILTTRKLMDAFTEITGSPDCRVITNTDLTKRFGKLKLMFSAGDCFDLAYYWSPEAIKTTKNYLKANKKAQGDVVSCASEVVKKMGGNEEERVLVSGFAGGMGLSGNGCGALSAAIWKKTLQWCRENPEEKGYNYPGVEDIVRGFGEATEGKFLCSEVSGKRFRSIDDHSAFIGKGGCRHIIDVLA